MGIKKILLLRTCKSDNSSTSSWKERSNEKENITRSLSSQPMLEIKESDDPHHISGTIDDNDEPLSECVKTLDSKLDAS